MNASALPARLPARLRLRLRLRRHLLACTALPGVPASILQSPQSPQTWRPVHRHFSTAGVDNYNDLDDYGDNDDYDDLDGSNASDSGSSNANIGSRRKKHSAVRLALLAKDARDARLAGRIGTLPRSAWTRNELTAVTEVLAAHNTSTSTSTSTSSDSDSPATISSPGTPGRSPKRAKVPPMAPAAAAVLAKPWLVDSKSIKHIAQIMASLSRSSSSSTFSSFSIEEDIRILEAIKARSTSLSSRFVAPIARAIGSSPQHIYNRLNSLIHPMILNDFAAAKALAANANAAAAANANTNANTSTSGSIFGKPPPPSAGQHDAGVTMLDVLSKRIALLKMLRSSMAVAARGQGSRATASRSHTARTDASGPSTPDLDTDVNADVAPHTLEAGIVHAGGGQLGTAVVVFRSYRRLSLRRRFKPWTPDEDQKLIRLIGLNGRRMSLLLSEFPHRSSTALWYRYFWLLDHASTSGSAATAGGTTPAMAADRETAKTTANISPKSPYWDTIVVRRGRRPGLAPVAWTPQEDQVLANALQECRGLARPWMHLHDRYFHNKSAKAIRDRAMKLFLFDLSRLRPDEIAIVSRGVAEQGRDYFAQQASMDLPKRHTAALLREWAAVEPAGQRNALWTPSDDELLTREIDRLCDGGDPSRHTFSNIRMRHFPQCYAAELASRWKHVLEPRQSEMRRTWTREEDATLQAMYAELARQDPLMAHHRRLLAIARKLKRTIGWVTSRYYTLQRNEKRGWTHEQDMLLEAAVDRCRREGSFIKWADVAKQVPGRKMRECTARYMVLHPSGPTIPAPAPAPEPAPAPAPAPVSSPRTPIAQ